MPSITYICTTFVKITFLKSSIFKVKFLSQMFSNRPYKKKFIISIPFTCLIINVKILFNFQKGYCTFDEKKNV